eukprot:9120456-Alexandrium_andersonii.AAC.1
MRGLKISPRSSRGVRSAPLLARIPNLPTKVGVAGGPQPWASRSREPQCAILDSRGVQTMVHNADNA